MKHEAKFPHDAYAIPQRLFEVEQALKEVGAVEPIDIDFLSAIDATDEASAIVVANATKKKLNELISLLTGEPITDEPA